MYIGIYYISTVVPVHRNTVQRTFFLTDEKKNDELIKYLPNYKANTEIKINFVV